MKRRQFLALGICAVPYIVQAASVDDRTLNSMAWKASTINEAAMALYGREKFSTIQKSSEIELIVPGGTVKNREEIPIGIRSSLKAKTLAIFPNSVS